MTAATTPGAQVRVLIVDDSPLMRQILRHLIEQDREMQVVGEASNGKEALDQVALLRPNVITMDVRMPVMDGLAATENIMAYYPTPILVVTASLARHDVDMTFRMLGAGALDVIEKPALTDGKVSTMAFVRRVKAIARMRVVTHLRGRRRSTPPANETSPTSAARTPETYATAPLPSAEPPPARALNPPPLVIIGASAGGPRIVRQLLHSLPPDFPAAVLVVQHITEGFGQGFVEWLAADSPLPICTAAAGDHLQTGRVTVAPDYADLQVARNGTLQLRQLDRASGQPRPSIDLAMSTAAASIGAHVTGVLLTGMGSDGAAGMLAIKQAGGHTVVQDEATAAIYGMPHAAIERNAVDRVLPPDDIALFIRHHVLRQVRRAARTPHEKGD